MRAEQLRVVCVEDDEDDIFLLRAILKGCAAEGMVVTWVRSLAELHDQEQQPRADVILAAYLFEDTRPENLRRIIQRWCGEKPVIFLSSWNDEYIPAEDAQAMGNYLQKREMTSGTICEAIWAAIGKNGGL